MKSEFKYYEKSAGKLKLFQDSGVTDLEFLRTHVISSVSECTNSHTNGKFYEKPHHSHSMRIFEVKRKPKQSTLYIGVFRTLPNL